MEGKKHTFNLKDKVIMFFELLGLVFVSSFVSDK